MITMPYFSVIIPLYNKENFIQNTVNSVLNQSFQDFELIIIDDCSTDNSLMKLNKFKDSIQIIKHTTNKGLSATRNTGIINSKAEYIAFLDADDLWKETFLEEIFILINKFPNASLFATNYEEFVNANTTILPKNGAYKFEQNSQINDFFIKSLYQPLYCPSSFCVKKDVFDTIGLYNTSITFGEDVDFNIRANLAYNLAYSNRPLVQYVIYSENQITQGKLSSKILTDFDFYDQIDVNISLKKFLDFQRYTKAKQYKIENNFRLFDKLKRNINLSNLNWKQIILLFSPRFILILTKRIKILFLKIGIRFTTYD